nr:DUF4244 domain-containing protein [Actinomyces sp.]
MHSTIIRTMTRALSLRWSLGGQAASGRAALSRTASLPTASCEAGAAESDPGNEAGMATAEYAIGTLAAAAFAGLLLAIMRSGSLRGVLQGLIESALSVG